MKKLYTTISLCLLLCWAVTSNLYAQPGQCLGGGCTGGVSFGAIQSTTSNTFVNAVGCTFGGEFNSFNVTMGNVYEWSMCAADGAAVGIGDNTLTLRNTTGTIFCYSDDLCGLSAKILWTATFTGVVRVHLNQFPCTPATVCNTMRWRQVSGGAAVDDLAGCG